MARKIISDQVKVPWDTLLRSYDPSVVLFTELNLLKNNIKEAAGDKPRTDYIITLIVETEVAED